MLIAIGRSGNVHSLKVLGIRVISLDEVDSHTLMERIREASAVIIEEDVYKEYEDRIKRVFKEMRYPPLIILVPGFGKTKTERLKDLYETLSTAVGVKLKIGAKGKSLEE